MTKIEVFTLKSYEPTVIDLGRHELHLQRARTALAFLEFATTNGKHRLTEATAVRLAVSALRWEP